MNFNAFAAKLFERRIWTNGTDWAFAMLETAFERPPEPEHEINVLAAAQWILWYRHSLVTEVVYGQFDLADSNDEQARGPLGLCLGRWHIWRDGFRSIGSKEAQQARADASAESSFAEDDEKVERHEAAYAGEQVETECQRVSAQTAVFMDALEAAITFQS